MLEVIQSPIHVSINRSGKRHQQTRHKPCRGMNGAVLFPCPSVSRGYLCLTNSYLPPVTLDQWATAVASRPSKHRDQHENSISSVRCSLPYDSSVCGGHPLAARLLLSTGPWGGKKPGGLLLIEKTNSLSNSGAG